MAPDLRAATAGPRFKGLSPSTYGETFLRILDRRPSLFDGTFSPPVGVLRGSALAHNIEVMGEFCRSRGVRLAPHGKTTLSPDLFDRQLAAGAWGITVATPAQAAFCRLAGIRRVLLANELVDPAAVRWIAAQLTGDTSFDFMCYVDSVDGVRLIADALRRTPSPRPFDVLIEVGPVGGRTGCRTLEEARAVAQAVARSAGVRAVGVAGYEGGLGHEITEDVLAHVRAFLGLVRATAQTLADERLLADRGDGIVLSAGGSVFFDEVVTILAPALAGHASACVLRSGAYVSHDVGHYEHLSPFTRPGASIPGGLRPALEVWGQVLSTPEPGLAIAGVGRRDVSFDLGMPVPQRGWRPGCDALFDTGACIVRDLNDQHAYMVVPDGADLRVGDWVSFGISHPCTAFDKWRLLVEVDDDYRVTGFVETFF
jgi:D-serine deaminase-like pyridoxal phosphate-dependent protein